MAKNTLDATQSTTARQTTKFEPLRCVPERAIEIEKVIKMPQTSSEQTGAVKEQTNIAFVVALLSLAVATILAVLLLTAHHILRLYPAFNLCVDTLLGVSAVMFCLSIVWYYRQSDARNSKS